MGTTARGPGLRHLSYKYIFLFSICGRQHTGAFKDPIYAVTEVFLYKCNRVNMPKMSFVHRHFGMESVPDPLPFFFWTFAGSSEEFLTMNVLQFL